MSFEYQTKRKTRKTVDFTLDGRDFTWNQPKDSEATLPLLEGGSDERVNTKVMFNYIGKGLTKEDEAFIETRLRDPDDDFDVEDLGAIVEHIVKEVATVPSMSQPGSGTRRGQTGFDSTDGQRVGTSIRENSNLDV